MRISGIFKFCILPVLNVPLDSALCNTLYAANYKVWRVFLQHVFILCGIRLSV